MQVRKGKFGRTGQTKWTHLAAEDTSAARLKDDDELWSGRHKGGAHSRKDDGERAVSKTPAPLASLIPSLDARVGVIYPFTRVDPSLTVLSRPPTDDPRRVVLVLTF